MNTPESPTKVLTPVFALAVPGAPQRNAYSWVPIRALSARHRGRVFKHLSSLGTQDRYLRFGSAATNEQIAHYVDLIDFDNDEVLGIFNRRLDLIAVAHLAFTRSELRQGQHGSAEFGVSVVERARGRGYGTRLFERAALHARNRGVDRLTIQALSENRAMLRIARQAGATIVRDGSEAQAEVILPPGDVSSHVEQWVEDAAAAVDFRLKANAKAVGEWFATMARDDVS